MKVFFTDLDGTLLETHTYSWMGAAPGVRALKDKGNPLVLCTSKTRLEVEFWRSEMGLDSPFIVENGGAVYIPRGYFPFPVPDSRERDGYDVIEFGDPYQELVSVLETASRESGCRALGFHAMDIAEVSLRTRLPLRQAELAKQREYDEPFEILDSGTHRLLQAIDAHGKHWTRGGRFYHITGNNNKATAVRRLTELYRQAHGAVVTVGLGDGWNDVDFLRAVDVPVLVRSSISDALRKAIPRSMVTDLPGTAGWAQAVIHIVEPEAVSLTAR